MTTANDDKDGFYKTLLESTKAIPWKLNWETKEFEYIGPQIEPLLGWTRDSWKTAMEWIERIHPDEREQTAGFCISQSECGIDHEADYRAVTADGGHVWVRDVVHVLRDNGKTTALVGFMFDISERKRMEDALREAKEAAEAGARAKSEFLAMMSHEIRTPMNGILGMLRLLLDGPLGPDQRDQAETARYSAEALLTILNDILDFSKLEAGRLDVESIPFNLHRVVTSVVELMRSRADEKGLELTATFEDGVPAFVTGDATRLRQILLNLVGNAVKFTEQGDVRITVTRLDGDRLQFAVADTGIGIPAEARHKLFADFSQVDGSIARRYGGTGLGLAICRRLVTLMGGTIDVESEPGRGSTFRFELALPPCAGAPVEEERPAAALPPLRILLAEDNPVNQKVACVLLGRQGHAVTVADDGLAALDAVQAGEFDLILMDMQMPRMDGLEATRRIRALADERRRRIPIIAMTANALKGDDERCLAAGMNDYVSKPVDPAALTAAMVRQVIPAGAGPHRKPAVDATILAHMEAAIGRDALVELLADFRIRAVAAAETIARSAASTDMAGLAEAAHDLKSMSGYFGLSGLYGCAEAVEWAAREGRADEAPALAAGIGRRLDEALAGLAARLGS